MRPRRGRIKTNYPDRKELEGAQDYPLCTPNGFVTNRCRSRAKYGMTPLDAYFGLFELIAHEEDRGRTFCLEGVQCEIDQLDGHALFTAVTPKFALALLFPGWYIGETQLMPVQMKVEGDLVTLFEWLPISAENKRAIIARLTIGKHDQTLLTLQF